MIRMSTHMTAHAIQLRTGLAKGAIKLAADAASEMLLSGTAIIFAMRLIGVMRLK